MHSCIATRRKSNKCILAYLLSKETSSALKTAITRARRQIALLEEYRTRLIADVVTGKLDVRAAAAQLPEEAGGDDAMDAAGVMVDNMKD